MPSSHELLTQRLSSVTASKLVGGMQQVTHEVMTKGAIVITRHEVPTMVMLSVERYLALEQAAEPDLQGLTRQFDDMLARMQAPDAVRGMAQAFEMSPAQLGRAAARAAVPAAGAASKRPAKPTKAR
jgi:PHD/YefM family antitoxin component YafN of YafNO toxin-antitoxin module